MLLKGRGKQPVSRGERQSGGGGGGRITREEGANILSVEWERQRGN